jgi:hypothetical protein
MPWQVTFALPGRGRCAVLLVRGPGPATGQVLHGLLDADGVPLDVLQVQAPSANRTASDLKQRMRRLLRDTYGTS